MLELYLLGIKRGLRGFLDWFLETHKLPTRIMTQIAEETTCDLRVWRNF